MAALLRGQRGAGSMEFALIGSLLLSLLLGSIEGARYLITKEALRSALAEAVRLATIRGSLSLNAGSPACTNLSGNLDGVTARVPFLANASVTASMSNCTTQSGITTVTVSVQSHLALAVSIFGPKNRVLTDSTQAIFN